MKLFTINRLPLRGSTVKIMLIILAGIFAGCQHEDLSFQQQNRTVMMMTMLRQDTSVSIAVQALDKAGMSGTLDTYGPFTIFIPDNKAFRTYFKNIGKTGINDLSVDDAKTLMTYHLLPTRLRSSDFIPGPQAVTTGRGDYITLDISKGTKSDALANGKARLYQTDIEYSNGIEHKMDAVLTPPIFTIGEFLLQNPQYSIMVAGLKRAGLMDTLTAAKNAAGLKTNITLFAETNDVLMAAGISEFNSMPLADLKDLMRYHLVPGNTFTSQYATYTPPTAAIGVIERWDNTISTLAPNTHIYYNFATLKPVNVDIDFRGSDIVMLNGLMHNVDKHMVFSSAVPRTQITHIFNDNLNYAYGIAGISSSDQPIYNNTTGRFRYFVEPGHPRGTTTYVLSYDGDSAGDSLISVVKNVRKGKYKIVINYKSGTRGDLQMMYGQDKIGPVKNYGATPLYYQNMEIGTYEFKTDGDKRMKWVSQASKLVGVVLDVMVLTPVN